MRLPITILAVIFIAGCTIEPSISNEIIIAEKDKCIEAGMDYQLVINGLTYRVAAVRCTKPDNK